jgi:hypothetical protein
VPLGEREARSLGSFVSNVLIPNVPRGNHA